MIEIWKTIDGYQDYEISNLGNARSKNRIKIDNNGVKRVYSMTYLKTRNHKGYKTVWIESAHRPFFIHRLVAQAFIPNPNHLPLVNHKNEIKSDNRVENLEWCTHEYNVNYGNCRTKISKTKTRRYGVKVKDRSTGTSYNSIKECAISLDISQAYVRRICLHLIKNPKFNLEFITDTSSAV